MAHPGRPRKCDPRVDRLRSDISMRRYDTAKQTLKEFGIDATDGEGRTALINAVIEKKSDFVHWLVDNGANINHQDRIGYSVLHFIGQEKLVGLARYFLDKGADPNLQDIHGNTPLWTAVFNEKLNTHNSTVVKLLLKYGANPDIVNKYDRTPRIMYQTFNKADISTVDISDV